MAIRSYRTLSYITLWETALGSIGLNRTMALNQLLHQRRTRGAGGGWLNSDSAGGLRLVVVGVR